jgi:hypothetical protein
MAPAETVIEGDRELLEDFYGLEEEINYNVLTPWLLRLILDDRLTVDKKLGMDQIRNKLQDEFEVGSGLIEWLLMLLLLDSSVSRSLCWLWTLRWPA